VRKLIPIVFLVLAVAFVADAGRGVRLPIPGPSGVTKAELHLGPPRVALREPPTVQSGPFRLECSECHRLFPSLAEPRVPLLQHREVVLDHGQNDRCYNCHSRENRDRLVLRGGESCGFDEVPRLCAQCHGTVYRDWQNGTHGRTLGSWDAAGGLQQHLGCSECHDPHAPAFPHLAPLPGPNTLRMGPQESEQAHGNERNPLEKWKASETRAAEAARRGEH